MENGNIRCNISEKYKFTTYTAVFSFIFVFGLLSNVGALYVFCKLSIKNRLSTIFLIHLASSDLMFIFTLPLRIAFYSHSIAPSPKYTPSAMDLACRFSTYIFYITMYCSILFLTALSVCRYLVLANRLRLQNNEACRWARRVCWGIWGFVFGVNMIYIAFTSGFSLQVEGCMEPKEKTWQWLYNINLVVLVIFFLLPLTVILICYSLMIRYILRIRAGQRQRDVALICLVLLIFCFCFLPYHIQRTLHLHYTLHGNKNLCQLLPTLQKTVVITLCFAAFNSCLDPFLFLFVGHGFLSVVNEYVAKFRRLTVIHSYSASASINSPVLQVPLVKDPERSEEKQTAARSLPLEKTIATDVMSHD